jgi:cell wall-associated NlpC family hydrolase
MLQRHKRRLSLIAPCLLVALPGLTATSSRAAPDRAQVEAAEDRLLELERDFQLVSERYNLVAEELRSLQARVATAELETEALERRIGRRQDSAISLARALYKGGSSLGVETVLASESITEIERQLRYLEASEQEQLKIFERLGAEKEALEIKIAELEAARADAMREQNRLSELRTTIEKKVESQRAEVQHLNRLLERARRREQARREQRRAAAARAAVTVPTVTVPKTPSAPNANAQKAVEAALSQLGKPYRWGAAGPDSYDCSGLTQWAWAHADVSLPHNSGAQYAATPRVARSEWAPGDLLFFGDPIHHVGMYIGDGRMVEAPYSGQVVRVNSAVRSDYVGAGRPG